jgi:LysM repeat protein
VYVVKGGDNLTRVAVRYGLTLDEVLERNPTISDPSHIVRGQKIRLPTPRR